MNMLIAMRLSRRVRVLCEGKVVCILLSRTKYQVRKTRKINTKKADKRFTP